MTSIADKAAYVRDQPGDGKHTCHWPGCKLVVRPSMWGCKTHWYALPIELRNKIWFAYRPGQEIDKKPSAAYLAAAKEVQEWIEEQVPW